MKTTITIILSFVLGLLIMWGFYETPSITSSISKFWDSTEKVIIPQQTTWAETPVVESINKMKRFIAVSYYEEIAQVKKKDTWFTDGEIVIIYKVTLKSGFDLSKLNDTDIYVKDSVITTVLPEPEILEAQCNPSDKVVFHNSDAWSNDEMSQFHTEAINIVKHNAYDHAIYKNTCDRGIEYFTQLFESFGFAKKNIRIFVKNYSFGNEVFE